MRALRSALQAYVREGRREPDIRRALRLLCAEARENGVQIEQLLVVFKHAWHSLPETRRLPADGDRDAMLGSVITMCIEEYYANRE